MSRHRRLVSVWATWTGSHTPPSGSRSKSARWEVATCKPTGISRLRRALTSLSKLGKRNSDYASPWFDYLIASPEEVERLVDGTGWHVARVIPGEPLYVAVLD